VVGTVKLTGRVILATEGFRAEKAEIESLALGSYASLYAHLNLLGGVYDVPTFDSHAALYEAFPPIPYNELIGVS
jgi:hypothetical protein